MRTYLRVGAIIFHEGKLLTTQMQKNGERYHVLPGGGVEGGETIEQALIREVEEELGLRVKKMRLAYVRELNLTIEGGGRGVEFYYYVEEYEGTPKRGYDPEHKEAHLEAVGWFDLEDLGKETFHPVQLIGMLQNDKKEEFSQVKYLGIYDYP